MNVRGAGLPLQPYDPQREALALLGCGDGTAIGCKWGIAFRGRWVWRLKDWIDRGWMRTFDTTLLNVSGLILWLCELIIRFAQDDGTCPSLAKAGITPQAVGVGGCSRDHTSLPFCVSDDRIDC